MESSPINYDQLRTLLGKAKTDAELFETVANAPFQFKAETAFLFLGIIVLLLIDEKSGMIHRIALSNTELAERTTEVSPVPFNEIQIPLGYDENIITKAIRSGKPQDTTDWKFLFEPALEAEQARINQASAGIAYSAVYPLHARDGGALIFSYFQYQQEIGQAQQQFMEQYAKIVDGVL